MNLCSPNEVRRILDEIKLAPGKSMGQNFLIDANILRIIIERAELKSSDRVLEIGPGLGVLTQAMLPLVAGLTAIEKDRKLHHFLEESLAADANLDLICADALDVDLAALLAAGINKFVSNLPYSVGSRILFDVFSAARRPELVLATLQHDVAARIVAPVGDREYGLLAILAQRFYEVEIAKEIGANCFLPRPRVGSALLLCRRRAQPLVAVRDEAFFLRLVKMSFTHRRKVMGNSLRGAGFAATQIADALAQADIDPQLRPAQLAPVDWGRLADALFESA
jgi:16S rRNA (adenine1518-N6/adenine1519-N6)-dimethyltransferase